MNKEKQRKLIAKAVLNYEDFDWLCSWRDKSDPLYYEGRLLYGAPKGNNNWKMVPDYLNDLNAMHDAEKILNKKLQEFRPQDRPDYTGVLHDICLRDRLAGLHWSLCTYFSTAAQRAEAFLRALSLWEDE